MVHITHRHGPYNSEHDRVILMLVHFYISDDRYHDLVYIQHCFQLFYDQLKVNNIQMDQHCIFFYGCTS